MTMPSAGWYPDPDPEDARQNRWWNGIAWTDNRTYAQTAPQAPVVPAGYSTSYATATVMPAQSSYSPGYPASAAPGGTASTTAWNTPWIWFLVGLPNLAGIASIVVNFTPGVLDDAGSQYVQPYSIVPYVPFLIGVAAYAVGVWLAFLDFRELQRRGVARPFHWAWAFLNNWFVYTIGRSIVVKNRTGRGLAPMWITLSIFVTALILTVGLSIYQVTSVLNSI